MRLVIAVEVKPATRTRLGAVIVGDGFNITEEGVLSVDEDALDEYVEFTRDELQELFQRSKARRQ